MRIVLITITSLALTIAGYAQETGLKPVAKEITAEMNFDPFSGNALSINYLRFRVFRSSQKAYRLGFAASLKSEHPPAVRRSYYEFNLRPGLEKHFSGTDRLSPYIGGEIDIAVKNSKITNSGPTLFNQISGAWSDQGLERGFIRLGFNFIAGTDFYFAKHFFVGTEFGFGLQYLEKRDIVISPTQLSPSQSTQTISGESSLQIGPNFNSSIRLGFVF